MADAAPVLEFHVRLVDGRDWIVRAPSEALFKQALAHDRWIVADKDEPGSGWRINAEHVIAWRQL